MMMTYPCGDCKRPIVSLHNTRTWYCSECVHRHKLEAKREWTKARKEEL